MINLVSEVFIMRVIEEDYDFQNYVKETFKFDDEGLLYRKLKTKWKQTGTINSDCYLHTKITYYSHQYVFNVHRLIWFLHYGSFPKNEIDHIDNNRTNNKISNLREATRLENSYNKKIFPNNSSGLKGVSFHKASKKWQATIRFDYKWIYLGLFSTPKEAAIAYDNKAIELFGKFARTNKSLDLI